MAPGCQSCAATLCSGCTVVVCGPLAEGGIAAARGAAPESATASATSASWRLRFLVSGVAGRAMPTAELSAAVSCADLCSPSCPFCSMTCAAPLPLLVAAC